MPYYLRNTTPCFERGLAQHQGDKIATMCGMSVPISGIPPVRGLLSRMRMTRCRELFAEFPVDASAARKAVPAPYQVRMYPEGNALLLLLVQECERCVLDGALTIRPMKMAHFWIELAGPEELGPTVPGTSASLPTSYYYVMGHQMDSGLAALAFWTVGIDVQRVAQITIGGEPGEKRYSKILERRIGGCGCSIEDHTPSWIAPQLLTGRRWFFRDYGRLLRRRSAGLVVCRSTFLGEGEAILRASEDSIVDRLGFGRMLRGISKAVEISCDVSIRVGLL